MAEEALTETERTPKQIRTLRWQAYEFEHLDKSADWYWIIGTVLIAGSLWAFLVGNWTLGALLVVITVSAFILGSRKPQFVDITLNQNVLTVGANKFPMEHYNSFRIKEETSHLILRHTKNYYPVLVVPIPPDKPTGKIRIILEDELELTEDEELDEPLLEQVATKIGL